MPYSPLRFPNKTYRCFAATLCLCLLSVHAGLASDLTLQELMDPQQTSAPTKTVQTAEPQTSSGTSLMDLMGDGAASRGEVQGQAAEVHHISPNATGGSLSLGDVEAGREAIYWQKRKAELQDAVAELDKKCSCTSSGCYDGWGSSIRLNQSRQVAGQLSAQLTQKKAEICRNFENNLDDSDMSPDSIERQIALTKEVDELLHKVDKAADDSFSDLAEKDLEARQQIAAIKKEQESQSGFDFMKMAAMGTGALIGGIDKLDPAAQSKIITGIIEDSKRSSGSGTAHFDAAMAQINADISSGNTIDQYKARIQAQNDAKRKARQNSTSSGGGAVSSTQYTQLASLETQTTGSKNKTGKQDQNTGKSTDKGKKSPEWKAPEYPDSKPSTPQGNSDSGGGSLHVRQIHYNGETADVTSDIPSIWFGTYDFVYKDTPGFDRTYQLLEGGQGYVKFYSDEPAKQIQDWGVMVANNEIIKKTVDYHYYTDLKATGMMIVILFTDGSASTNTFFMNDGQPCVFGPYGAVVPKTR